MQLQFVRWYTRWRAARGQPGTHPSDRTVVVAAHGFAHKDLEGAFAEACRALDLEPLDEPRRSEWHKSIGAGVRGLDGTPYWMKVTGIFGPTAQWWRDGEESAAAISGVPKPSVARIHDWARQDIRWRALLMTPAPSPMVGPPLTFGLGLRPVTDRWIGDLKSALVALGKVATARFRWSGEYIRDHITLRFGRRAPYLVDEWRTAHGDLHWSQVTSPNLCLLDWELWSLMPRGYDISTLIVHSCANPELVARLRAAFADDLSTPSGRAAQLIACINVLKSIEAGYVDPRFHEPVEKLARQVLRST